MNCEELVRYLSDYIDRNLSEELEAEARAHLASCPNCHVVLNTTQKTITLFRECEVRVIPAERREVLFQALQQAFSRRG